MLTFGLFSGYADGSASRLAWFLLDAGHAGALAGLASRNLVRMLGLRNLCAFIPRWLPQVGFRFVYLMGLESGKCSTTFYHLR
jgi:hypothetical protein